MTSFLNRCRGSLKSCLRSRPVGARGSRVGGIKGFGALEIKGTERGMDSLDLGKSGCKARDK